MQGLTLCIFYLHKFHKEHSFKIVYNPLQSFTKFNKVTQSFTTVNNR